jgi:universal stress protein E
MTLGKIMVIVDPTCDTQPAFVRALESAHMTGARLHLYACLESSGTAAAEMAERRVQAQMRNLLDQAIGQGIEATGEVEWAPDWRKQAVAAAARCSAAMIFKSWTPHSDVERQMRITGDWTLLRIAPCPVLLVKNIRNWRGRCVLAAVECETRDDVHQKLNNQIISFAQRFSDAYGSDTHIVTAYQDRNRVPNKAGLAEVCGVAESFVHIHEGKPADVIRQVADDIAADLILIGTVGRSGLKGTVVGNTSERLLDHTDADLLVLN